MNKSILDKINADPIKFANSVKITDLVKYLKIMSDTYYNTDTNIVSDKIFDELKDVLQERDPNNKFLQQVGSQIKQDKKEIKLPYPMGSLNKIKPDKDNLTNWLKKYPGPYVLSDKMDGISAQLYIESKNNYKLYTRGDGIKGFEITNLISYIIKNNNILNKLPVNMSIRGEIIISKENFKTISDVMKNPRNAVSGIVNSKTLDDTFKKMANLCDFVCYEIINPRMKQHEQFELLKKYNLQIAPYKIVKDIDFDILSIYFKQRREISPYEIDGIVVVDDSKIHTHIEGYPDYAFAFKTVLDDQIAIARVVRVIWDPSMDGYMKPKIEVEPFDINGVTITYATAFNAKFVQENKLGPGAQVKLVRSGDVIPHIMEVIKPATSGNAQMPDIPYKWTPTNVDIIVQDIFGAQHDIITIKRLSFFFKSIDAKYISEGIITKLVNAGYKTVKAILSADKDKLKQIDGIGETLINKIYASINEAFKKIKLSELMAASHIFGRGLGERKIKEITQLYPNILNEEWDNKTCMEKIMLVEGFSNISSKKFCDNLNEFKKFITELENIVDISHLKQNVNQQNVNQQNVNQQNINQYLTGKIFVFTGFRDKNLKERVESLGGKVQDSVSKKVTNVIKPDDSDEKSSKILDADKFNVEILPKTLFINKYKLQ